MPMKSPAHRPPTLRRFLRSLGQPAYLLLAVSAAGYLAGWIYLDGYLAFFGAERVWFEVSFTRLMGFAWPALAGVAAGAVLLLAAAVAVSRGFSSLATGAVVTLGIMFALAAIDFVTAEASTGGPVDAESIETFGGMAIAFAGLLILQRGLDWLSRLSGPVLSGRMRLAGRVVVAFWVVGVAVLSGLVAHRLGGMSAAWDHAIIRQRVEAFGSEATLPVVFS